MPLTDEEKYRILNYESQIVALRLLQGRKSQLAVKAALWKNIYQAQLEVAHLDKRIANLDSARRKIIIVAVSGAVSCFASFVVASALARAGGYAYTSFSLATPLVVTTVESGGSSRGCRRSRTPSPRTSCRTPSSSACSGERQDTS